jgi:hypothetical protein
VRRLLLVLTFVLAFPSQALADTPAQLAPRRDVNATSNTRVTTGITSAGYVVPRGLGAR